MPLPGACAVILPLASTEKQVLLELNVHSELGTLSTSDVPLRVNLTVTVPVLAGFRLAVSVGTVMLNECD